MADSPKNFIDTKLLGKPKTYRGNRAEWPAFKFVFSNYIGAISESLASKLEQVEKMDRTVIMNTLSEQEKADARRLAYILSQVLESTPLTAFMNVPQGNGFEGWRRLVQREEPRTGSHQVGMLLFREPF